MTLRMGDVVLVETKIVDRYSNGDYQVESVVGPEQIVGIVRQAFRKGDKVQIGAEIFEIRAIDGDMALVRDKRGAHDHVNLKLATRVDE